MTVSWQDTKNQKTQNTTITNIKQIIANNER